MPVQFKGASEYKTHYKWLESFRSQQFKPAVEQAMDPAGQASVNASLTMEPPLQHKKRVDGPPTSLSHNYFNGGTQEDDYALLGNQEKFASNVRYRPKQTMVVQGIYKNKENMDVDSPPNKQLRMQKRIKPLLKERHPPVRQSSPPRPREAKSPVSPPPAPRPLHDPSEQKAALRDKDLKAVLDEPPKGGVKEVSKPAAPALQAKAAKGGPLKAKVVSPPKARETIPAKTKPEAPAPSKPAPSNLNEFTQTDMKKGAALSAPEAPADHALKYKAGIAPPRPLRKVSEYQKQFQWKAGQKASPLLAAEEVVYQSHADLGPYKSEAIPKMSEYQRQFLEWRPSSAATGVGSNLNLNSNNNNNNNKSKEEVQPKEKARVKRSKSAGEVKKTAQAEEEEEGEKAGETCTDKLKEKLVRAHGKVRKLGTEYRNNFKSPTRYSYEHGAWKGANPPQLFATTGALDDNSKPDGQDAPLSNWFAEVLELRRRAMEYRKRAEGTHFSREHLVQLMAGQNRCWDAQSSDSPTIDALDLEMPHTKAKAAEPLQPAREEEESPQKEEQTGQEERRGKDMLSRKMAWLEEHKQKVADLKRQLAEPSDQETEELGDSNPPEGRLPTPVLQDQPGRRHHLDRTTPSVGGALLTCPNPAKDGGKIIVTSRSGDSYVTASDEMPVKAKQSYDLERLVTIPTLGKPSGDSHALRDDEAASDRRLITHYVASPELEDKENKAVRPRGKPKGRRSRSGNLSTVKEGEGKTYSKPRQFFTLEDVRASAGPCQPREDDLVSVSLMSVASSQSLASEVLERAKRRQDFWDTKK